MPFFFNSPQFVAPPSGLPLTAYTQAYGSGAREQWVPVTKSAGLTYTGTLDGLVDGSTGAGTGQGFFAAQAIAGERLTFGPFPREVLITGIKYYQQDTTAQGTWQCEISDDGIAWTAVGSNFALGGTATQTITEMAANTTGCLYVSILGVSGNSSNVPFVYQFEFECGVFGDLSDLPLCRLQIGLNGSPVGVYQDAACTVPATADFDPVWTIVDELGITGTRATQADSNKQMYLFEQAAGIWVLVSDGVDDGYLTTLNLSSPYSIAFSGKANGAPASNRFINSDSSNRLIAFNRPSNAAFLGGTVVNSTDTVPGTTPAVGILTEDAVAAVYVDNVDVTTNPSFSGVAWGVVTIGVSAAAGETFDGYISGLFLATSVWSAPDRTTIDTYMQTLLP